MPAQLPQREVVSVAMACSELYSLPLAAAIRSALEQASLPVELYVLADGIKPATKVRLLRSWEEYDLQVTWIDVVPPEVLSRVQLTGYAGGPTTYFRLLISELLPAELTKVIFLDADLIVQGDLADLWHYPIESGHVLRATPIRPSLAVMLGFEPTELVDSANLPAFNAGVMLIDLVEWRRLEMGEQAMEFAVKYRTEFHQWDQSALNCAIIGKWGPLPLAWNYRPDDCGFPAWTSARYGAIELEEAERAPKIVHYAGAMKPWDQRAVEVQAEFFRGVVDRTDWQGWSRPEFTGFEGRVWSLFGQPHRRVTRLLEIIGKCHQSGVSHWSFTRLLIREVASKPWLVVSFPLSMVARRLRPTCQLAPRPKRLRLRSTLGLRDRRDRHVS